METKERVLKVFLSHPMHGLSEDFVKDIREKAKEYLEKKYGKVEIIDNYTHPEAPENAGRLWHLGRSIQQLEEADAIYFCKDFQFSNGCCVEFFIAKLYNLQVLH